MTSMQPDEREEELMNKPENSEQDPNEEAQRQGKPSDREDASSPVIINR